LHVAGATGSPDSCIRCQRAKVEHGFYKNNGPECFIKIVSAKPRNTFPHYRYKLKHTHMSKWLADLYKIIKEELQAVYNTEDILLVHFKTYTLYCPNSGVFSFYDMRP
jgi:hypothetical protein